MVHFYRVVPLTPLYAAAVFGPPPGLPALFLFLFLSAAAIPRRGRGQVQQRVLGLRDREQVSQTDDEDEYSVWSLCRRIDEPSVVPASGGAGPGGSDGCCMLSG